LCLKEGGTLISPTVAGQACANMRLQFFLCTTNWLTDKLLLALVTIVIVGSKSQGTHVLISLLVLIVQSQHRLYKKHQFQEFLPCCIITGYCLAIAQVLLTWKHVLVAV
jgi:hypothetical protein